MGMTHHKYWAAGFRNDLDVMEKKIIITIGRQFGSGGRAVAKVLGEKLGIAVYDKELLVKAAEESGISKDFFKHRDEKRHGISFAGLAETWRFNTDGGCLGEDSLFKIQSETIRRIAENGSAVIIGRCSDYILRDFDCTVNVFLSSPFEQRLANVMERMKVDEDTAKSIISKKDRKRPEYYNYYTFRNWGEASNYELCIDTSKLGVEGTADLIIDYARKKNLI